MRGNICVYMLDGERSYANSESPQKIGMCSRALYGTRAWRGRAAHGPLATLEKEKKDPYKGPFKLYFMKFNLQTLTF